MYMDQIKGVSGNQEGYGYSGMHVGGESKKIGHTASMASRPRSPAEDRQVFTTSNSVAFSRAAATRSLSPSCLFTGSKSYLSSE